MPTGAGVSGGGPGGRPRGQVIHQLKEDESGHAGTHALEGAGALGVGAVGVDALAREVGARAATDSAANIGDAARFSPESIQRLRALGEHTAHVPAHSVGQSKAK